MSSPVACTLLFRWILPLVLLGACCFRFNGFSVIYLCCLLAIPLLPNPSRDSSWNKCRCWCSRWKCSWCCVYRACGVFCFLWTSGYHWKALYKQQ
ncbi:mechanosensitive ion channel [Desmophyllum pertusum]|uniref:Mechanosensitive ion channel n=1 Tax=Desmophyllum pertusum TaxID=174260 RepID=A0A9W9YVW3_9CNID|nr:mechanosensitive ion channel [Desmophyllum pertusum]